VSNTERTGAITGKISATPNPIPFGQGYVLISWETNDPSGGEMVAYCMIRHFQPRLIIEVGSGFSSLVAAEAIARNGRSELICIEPFPPDFLRKGVPGLRSLIEKNVEDIGLEFFSQLQCRAISTTGVSDI
jgi:hypothetical protein